MKVKVTDPCYVIDTKEWDEICDKAASMPGDWSENFNQIVTEYLREKTGKDWAVAGDTGYGDWSNHMSGESVVKAGFYADAGMWCVVPAEFNERDDMKDDDGAILEFDDGPITVVVTETNDREWTEFSVTGQIDGRLSAAYSEPYRSDEEE